MATPMSADRLARGRWTTERRFYTGMALALFAAVFLGFAETYYLMRFFPEAAANAPPETYFFRVHGVLFTAWFVLLIAQTAFVGVGRTDLHRLLGVAGVALAGGMIVTGIHGALLAATRPGGFMGIPLPAWQFLIVPVVDMLTFGAFVALAVAKRRDAQAHKRLMLLATLSMMTAAVVRWPIELGPVPILVAFVVVDLFLVPIALRDWRTRGKLHPVTLWGGLAVVVSQPLRLVLSGTPAWKAVAERLVALVG